MPCIEAISSRNASVANLFGPNPIPRSDEVRMPVTCGSCSESLFGMSYVLISEPAMARKSRSPPLL